MKSSNTVIGSSGTSISATSLVIQITVLHCLHISSAHKHKAYIEVGRLNVDSNKRSSNYTLICVYTSTKLMYNTYLCNDALTFMLLMSFLD